MTTHQKIEHWQSIFDSQRDSRLTIATSASNTTSQPIMLGEKIGWIRARNSVQILDRHENLIDIQWL